MATMRRHLAVRRPADVGLDTRFELQRLLDQLTALEARLPTASAQATVKAARRLNRSAATLATSVLPDSAVEHYRGSFKNKAMFTPLIISALTLAVSAHGTADKRPAAHGIRDATYASGGADGSGRDRVSCLQRDEAARRNVLAESVLRRTAWGADGDPAIRPAGLLLGAGARHVGRALGAGVRAAGGSRAWPR